MQVLGHPTEADRPERAEPFEFFGHLNGRRNGRDSSLHVNGFRPVGKNQRGLHIASMNAVALLHPLERAGRITEAVPCAGHHQHLEAHAQIAGDQIHGRHIASMAGDDYELAHPASVEAFADLRIGAYDRSRGK